MTVPKKHKLMASALRTRRSPLRTSVRPRQHKLDRPDQEIQNIKLMFDESSKANRNFLGVYLTFLGFVTVTLAGITDMDLLIGKGIALPIVGGSINAELFFPVVTVLILLAQFLLLFNLKQHQIKFNRWQEINPNVTSRFPFG